MKCFICSEEFESDNMIDLDDFDRFNHYPCFYVGKPFCSGPCTIKYLKNEINKFKTKLKQLEEPYKLCYYCYRSCTCADLVYYDGGGNVFCSEKCMKKYSNKIKQIV